MHDGVILEVVEGGLAYVEEEGTKKRFAFRFGRIRDYRGESAQELGLHVGSRVRFTTTGELVNQVDLIDPGQRRFSQSETATAEKAMGAKGGA